MQTIAVLDEIPVEFNLADIASKLHVEAGSDDWNMLSDMVNKSGSVSLPKAVCKIAFIEKREGDTLWIDRKKFESRILRINLEHVDRVFAYVVTCGREMDERIECRKDDFMAPYYLDVLKETALGAGVQHVENYLRKRFGLKKISSISPGSLSEWPVTSQVQLFSLFGDVEKLIGVTLTPSCLMIPNKSVSGIYFETEKDFFSCQLCPRKVCRGRRAQFDPVAAKKYQP